MTANTPPGTSWKTKMYDNPNSPNKGLAKFGEAYIANAIGEKMWQRTDGAIIWLRNHLIVRVELPGARAYEEQLQVSKRAEGASIGRRASKLCGAAIEKCRRYAEATRKSGGVFRHELKRPVSFRGERKESAVHKTAGRIERRSVLVDNQIIKGGNMINETTPQIPLTITRTSIFTGFAALLAVGLGLASSASAQVQPQTPAGTFTEQKVTASDGTANTFFGSAAAIKGTTAVIGADGDASFRGSAYVFNKTGDIWTEGQKLVPSDGLGRRVRLSRRARPRQPARDRL